MMQEQKKSITRREFISKSIKGVGLVGVTAAVGLTASRLLIDRDKKSSSVANAFKYDLGNLSATDPALIRYREAGRITTRFQHLRAIATDPDDRIYLAADRSVQIFSGDTSPLTELKLDGSPRCLNVTDDGTIYVGMKDYVAVYGPKGVLKEKWGNLGQNAVLTAITVSGGDIFVADAGNREVLRYDASGRILRRIGKRNESRGIPGFIVPSPYFDLAVAPDGLLRVANTGQHRIEAYTFDGDLEVSWGNPSMAIDGFCGCCNPINFAMLPDGRFVTCEKGIPRVKVYSAEGVFESVVAGSEQFAENERACNIDDTSNCQTGGMDVAVDSKGRVLVMDPVEKVVRVFEQIRETDKNDGTVLSKTKSS